MNDFLENSPIPLWILCAFWVIIGSTLLYLFLRGSRQHHMKPEIQNLSFFLLPTVFLYIFGRILGIGFHIPDLVLWLLVASGVFLSFLGNKASLLGIAHAPNPGYSLILSKSYVVFTTLVSVWLFDAKLDNMSLLWIICIIVFSGLVVHDPGNKNLISSHKWFFYTLIAFFSWGILAIVLKHVIDLGIHPVVALFYLMFSVTVCSLLEVGYTFHFPRKVTLQKTLYFILLGCASTLLNLSIVWWYEYAPNPGYINAANAGSIALVTVLSHLLYRDELRIQKLVWVVGVTIGLILLFLTTS